jgi:hypothetical protein
LSISEILCHTVLSSQIGTITPFTSINYIITTVTGITDTITVRISLIGVGVDGAVVADIAYTVSVTVFLAGVRRVYTVVVLVTHTVLITVIAEALCPINSALQVPDCIAGAE